MATTIMIVEDHKIMLEGLRSLVERQENLQVVGEATNGREAVERSAELQPDVIVMDVTMPDMNGIEATRLIKQQQPDIRIVALSAYDQRELVLGMIKAGASGYLIKDTMFEELLRAIETVMRGESYISPAVTEILVDAYVGRRPNTPALNEKDIDIMRLLATGKSAKEIAYEKGLSVKTVEAHRRKLFQKTGVESIAELVHFAISEGIVPLQKQEDRT